ncbi:hypothetical protein AMIS_24480 [Actinoplanes missouriensis 431]|uniref:Uncharacterized protein n=1 Tax=Actinoplanes missouriensis (strain ATCC 14538 / DSM 43046 / CBS 188.64 / JCM 3121 / NBRC 102363 / NCIMB 12654 / NRRL B-3342 / UNCC 431) TaxID=512565 RepID=I0H3T1_ACTM4|nr:DUF6807 family protein [Actinoplanes missouriensis]BAL87668.1 hypothetical protein AMIS_24480 [Actinoplanes missouriensis 431]
MRSSAEAPTGMRSGGEAWTCKRGPHPDDARMEAWLGDLTPDLRVGHDPGRSVTVSAGDVPLLTYTYRPSPTLSMVRTLADEPVPGVTWSPPHIDEHPRLHPAGDHTLSELSATGTTATAAHRLVWTGHDGAPVLDEWRAITAALTGDDSWVLMFENTLTNVSGAPLTFGAAGAMSGGLRWRGALSYTGDGPWEVAAEVPAPATVVLVDDDANPHHPPLRSPGGHTIAFRHAAVITAGPRDTGTLAALGRTALSAP